MCSNFAHHPSLNVCLIDGLPKKPAVERKVVKDFGHRQVVDINQEGKWRFLMFSGRFPVRLRVIQDRHEKSVGCVPS